MKPSTPSETLHLPNADFFGEVERWLASHRTVTLKAVGSSMYPFLVGGRDQIVIQRPQLHTLQRGQIVLARLPQGNYVLHRIWRMDGEAIILMGDGNLYQTERCTASCIVGQATTLIRKGKAIDCQSRKERFLAALWRCLLPVRRPLLFLARLLKTKER